MSWDAFVKSIDWWHEGNTFNNGRGTGTEFSVQDQQKILAALQFIYLNSPSAQAIMDALATTTHLEIYQETRATGAYTLPDNRLPTIGLNIQGIANSYYVNAYGTLTQEPLDLAIIHEISHAFMGTTDPLISTNSTQNSPDYNFFGSVIDTPTPSDGTVWSKDIQDALKLGAVGIENLVASEIANRNFQYEKYERSSYWSSFKEYNFITDPFGTVPNPIYSWLSTPPYTSFTGGSHVDIVRYGDIAPDSAGGDTIDMSARTDDKAMLVFGFNGGDRIVSGSQNDYLYGGDGNDTFTAGAGNNFIHGGMLGGDIKGDGIDTVQYVSSTGNGANTGAIITLDGGGARAQSFGKSTILVSDNGFADSLGRHGNDALVSIERIEGVKELDVSSLDLSKYALTPNGSDPTLLWVAGNGSSTLALTGSLGVSFGTASDPAYTAVLNGTSPSGLAVKGFTTLDIRGGGDFVKFGAINPFTQIAVSGSGDHLDFSASSGGTSTSVNITGSGTEIDAGSGGLSASDASGTGKFVLLERWSDYNISGGSGSYTITAKDGSGSYHVSGFATYKFADGTLDGNHLLNQAPNPKFGSDGHFSDSNVLDHLAYTLDNGSDAFASVSTVGVVSFNPSAAVDYTFWSNAIVSVYGLQTAEWLDPADFSTLVSQANLNKDPAKAAALAAAFADTPYVAFVEATDAAGQSAEVPVFKTDFASSFGLSHPTTTSLHKPIAVSAPSTDTNLQGASVSVGDGASYYATNGTVVGGNNDLITGSNINVVAGDNAQVTVSDGNVTVGANAQVDISGTQGQTYYVNAGANSWVGDGAFGTNLSLSAYTNVYSFWGRGNVVGRDPGGKLFLNENLSDFHVTANPDGDGHAFLLTSALGSQILEVGSTTTFVFNDVTLDVPGLMAWQAKQDAIAAGTTMSFASTTSWQASASTANLHPTSSVQFGDVLQAGTHTTTIEYVGSTPQLGTLSGLVHEAQSTTSGYVALTYNLNSANLATAPKGVSTQQYRITVSDPNGHSVSHDYTVNVTGLGQTTSISGLPIVGVTENPAQAAATADGTMTVSDSDLSDVHALSFSRTGSTGPSGFNSPLGILTTSLATDTTQTGSGQVVWHYSVDESVLRTLQPNSHYSESFIVTLDDGLGGTANKTITFAVNTAPSSTSMDAVSPIALQQSSDYLGVQTKTGKIFFTDANPSDVHVLAPTDFSWGNKGTLQASIVHDTTNGGQGEIDWTYSLFGIDTIDMQFGQNAADKFGLTLSDQRGAQTSTEIDVGILGTAPTSPPSIPDSQPITLYAGSPLNSVGISYSFADPDTAIHHTISVAYQGTGSPMGIMTGAVSDPAGGSAVESYSLTYTIDPTILAAMQDGQMIAETWHVTLGSEYGLTAEQDQTVTVTRQNLTHFMPGPDAPAFEADVPAPSWSPFPPGGLLFEDGNVEAHTVSATFKSSSDGGGPLGEFSAQVLYETWNAPQFLGGYGAVGWNYDASHVRPTSHSPQTVTEVWTVNLDDGHGGITSQDVNVTIDVPASTNQAPVVGAIDAGTVSQNDAPKAINLLSTTTDPENDPVSVVPDSFSATTADGRYVWASMQDGVVTIDPGQFRYLGAGQSTSVSFGFDVTDGVDTTHGTGSFMVHGENDAPVFWGGGSAPISTTHAPISINLIDFSWDADGDAISLVGTPTVIADNGHSVAFSMSGGTITIDPSQFGDMQPLQTADLHVSFGITDGMATSEGGFDLTVVKPTPPVDHAPVVSPVAPLRATPIDAPISIDLLATASDPDQGDVVSLAGTPVVTAADGHAVAFTMSGSTLTIDPSQFGYLQSGQESDLTISFDVTDGHLTAAGSASLTVAQPLPPITSTPVDGGTTTVGFMPGFNIAWIYLPANAHDSTPGAVLSVVPSSIAFTTSDGHTVDYTMYGDVIAIDPSQFMYLQAGQHENIAISYQLTDGTNTATAEALLTIDPPGAPSVYPGTVYVRSGANGSYQPGNHATAIVNSGDWHFQTADGQNAFTSPTLYDLEHMQLSSTISVSDAHSADGAPLSLTAAQIAALDAGFTAGQDPSVDGPEAPSYAAWHYAVNDTALSFLTHGDVVRLAADIIATDTHGQSADQPYTIDVYGPNAAPALSLGGFGAYPMASDASYSDIVQFTDADGTDVHTVGPATFVTTINLSTGQASAIQHFGDFTAAITQDTTATNHTGTVSWTYTLDQAKAATLSQGESVLDIFSGLAVSDNFGGAFSNGGGAIVTGVNSAPTVAAAPQAANISVDPNHGAGMVEIVGDSFVFKDANWHDTHGVSASLVSTNFGSAALGTFSSSVQTDAINGIDGSIAWHYTVDDAALAGLGDNQVVHEIYDLAITDNHGAVAHQQVALNLSHYPLSA
ncbi:hypothetical protein [Bradyrhizobium guangzhouense]|uniref:Tandem-95 repeat protein n=1 Tax=Bradyrhizobium guangzhouense TaxID=1325095 RepID=A0AAE6CAQ2_9BRAD|nr:hypothetical protein [Bradyrhizobium guangzhouense]QAU48867.1 hypothetical protein XH91_28265 [Bradyrhizobium guangzhouense]